MWEPAVPSEPVSASTARRRPDAGAFAALHPAVTLGYFVFVIGVTIFVPHPVLLACSLAGALLLTWKLRGGRATGKLLAGLIPLALVAAAINPLFNHQGVTILGYLGGNPLTRESLLYGAALACMLAAVLLWFSCYNLIVTTEKFLAVFGRVVPSLALVVSMALGFVPRYLRQLKLIAAAQRGLGRGGTAQQGGGVTTTMASGPAATGLLPVLRARAASLIARTRSGFALLSILTSWALESALDTADSMRARGWGLPGRSTYQPFRFTARDAGALALILVCAAAVIIALVSGVVSAQYLPRFLLDQGGAGLPAALRGAIITGGQGAFGLLCLAPVLFEAEEELAWHISRSTI